MEDSNIYNVYGHSIESDFDLSSIGLSPIKGADQNPFGLVKIRKMDSPRPKPNYIDNQTAVSKHQGFYYRKGIGLFEFCRGKELRVYPETQKFDADFIRILLNYPMACIFFQKDFFTLHASAVYFKKKAIIFPGGSLTGKSTLAAYFLNRGAKLITEDTAVIRLQKGKAKIQPSYPFIKLSKNANQQVSFSKSRGVILPKDKNDRSGYILGKTHFQSTSVTLDYCVFLNWRDQGKILKCIKPVKIFAKLLESSLNIYPLTREKQKYLLKQNAEFFRCVESFQFEREKSFATADFLIGQRKLFS